jgi:hypothetical protein
LVARHAAAPTRPAGGSGRRLAALVALAAALVAAFFLAPARLATNGDSHDLADHRHLVATFHSAFVGYWRSGERDLTPDLARVVDYWLRYHVAKGAIAAVLLAVLLALTVLLWKTYLRTEGLGPVRRVALAASGAFTALLSLFSLTAVMANIQGWKASFSSLIPMLQEGGSDQALATSLEQARQGLAGSARTGAQTPPALDVMTDDFARYHVVMAVVAAIVAAGLLGTAVLLWRRFATTATTQRRTRRVLGSFGAVSVVLTLGMLVLMAASISVANDAAPALLAALQGGL